MHKHTLRELSKFGAGLIAADFLCGLWLYTSGLLPHSFFGLVITNQNAIVGMVFDVIIFAFLVHFGWRKKDRPKTKREHYFHVLAGIIFAVVAIIHLSRLLLGWQMVLGSWEIPLWLNGLGAVIATFLSYASFGLAD